MAGFGVAATFRCAPAIRSIGGPVLVRVVLAVLPLDDPQVVVGIERDVAALAVADLEIARRRRASIHEVMRVALARRVARAFASAKGLLAVVRGKHNLAFDHVDELVLQRVPMAQRRLAAGRKRYEIDAEARKPACITQAMLDAVAHARAEWLGVCGTAMLGSGLGIERGQAYRSHRSPWSSEKWR